jgi:hypothetical protein
MIPLGLPETNEHDVVPPTRAPVRFKRRCATTHSTLRQAGRSFHEPDSAPTSQTDRKDEASRTLMLRTDTELDQEPVIGFA